MTGSRIILASASPRRSELLESAGIRFQVVPGHIDETPLPQEAPVDHVLRLAAEKAREVARREAGDFFIGADTIVLCDGEIMGKPCDRNDADRMLRKLSGVGHSVITGYAVYSATGDVCCSQSVETRVYFKALTDKEISDYIATGCPMDKAGAYAIQGGAAHMVRRIEGSYTNVVGLPLCEVIDTLRDMGAI
ncbi:septum formation inhibitor Maf [Geobacter pelophilus]|uniref:dTTP/UTP pyrophosphatase n=1 Tax=Geoanaerobacter pelophilus TaxID=60036 RepID=A0AAW4L634_9BACT|nr:Maf family nucleotide pyrophosphatase [Geoanaerobacter pelophilus]MBT0666254.1 septum formation inhibitor Maf [Geoanaerobacter pelophilus]